MSLPRVGIIGTGFFGTALKNAWTPLIGKTIETIDAWETSEERPSRDPEILVLAIPSTAKNGNKLAILDYIESFPKSSIVVTSKGRKALEIFHEHISPTDKWRVFSISGPNLADQLGHTPTATKIAGQALQLSEFLAQTLSSNVLDVEASESVEIVQRGGMLKNFLVFELGKLWEKLETTQLRIEAIIMALRAGFESVNMSAPGEEDRSEFFGISGLGDILLCLGIFPEAHGSRNFRAGRELSSGKNKKEVLEKFQTLEGLIMSQEFHERQKSPSFNVPAMEKFRTITSGDLSGIVPKQNMFPELTVLMRSVWKKFIRIAQEKNFQSNTYAWVACELLTEVANANLVSLAKWESAEPLLRALLETLLIGQEISTNPNNSLEIWNRLIENLPFLNTSSGSFHLKHLLPASCRHSTKSFLGWEWARDILGIQRRNDELRDSRNDGRLDRDS